MQEMKNLEYDMDYILRKNKFKRKGYKFVRWNTKADGSGKKYGNKEEIENLSAKTVQLLICMHSGQGILTRSLTKRTAENLRMVLQRNTT